MILDIVGTVIISSFFVYIIGLAIYAMVSMLRIYLKMKSKSKKEN